MNQGDRRISQASLVLSTFAAGLILAFRGDTQSLLPLYMIGVFVSFTLSQAGMVIHWRRTAERGWRTSALINGFGALVTGVVLIIVAVTKTVEGAWIVLLLIPLIVMLFNATRRHYDHVGAAHLAGTSGQRAKPSSCRSEACSGRSSKLRYAGRCPTCLCRIDPKATEQIRKTGTNGEDGCAGVLPSPFRSVMERCSRKSLGRDRPADAVACGSCRPAGTPAAQPDAADQGRASLPPHGGLACRSMEITQAKPSKVDK